MTNSHLSADEIAQWVAGERTAELERHVNSCGVCGGEVSQMEAAIREFRGAVRASGAPPALVLRAPNPTGVARWVLAGAMVLALTVAAPVYRRRQLAAETARADTILLEQVDAEVSEAVPRPMEPLVQLVSWNSSSEGNGETK